jgi:hypothetical protein
MKVFRKLITENLIPQWMYMDLFKAVSGRLKDQAVNVRKGALMIFQDLLIVCGFIFGVDMKKGDKFLTIEEVQKELQESQTNFA